MRVLKMEGMSDMRPYLIASFVGLPACLLLACASSTVGDSGTEQTLAPTESNPYDGNWSGTIKTTAGDCQRLYEFDFTVREGAISGQMQGLDYAYVLGGKVASDGTIEGMNSFGPGRGNGKFEGHFDPNSAEGHWRTDSCNGAFQFTRKGSS